MIDYNRFRGRRKTSHKHIEKGKKTKVKYI